MSGGEGRGTEPVANSIHRLRKNRERCAPLPVRRVSKSEISRRQQMAVFFERRILQDEDVTLGSRNTGERNAPGKRQYMPVKITESYVDYSPPLDYAAIAARLLAALPVKYFVGLDTGLRGPNQNAAPFFAMD